MYSVAYHIIKLPLYYDNLIVISRALNIVVNYFRHHIIPFIRSYKRTVKKTILISICDILLD